MDVRRIVKKNILRFGQYVGKSCELTIFKGCLSIQTKKTNYIYV